MGPLNFVQLHVRSQALCVFRTNFWYMITTREQQEDCMSPRSSLYSNDLFIQLASLIFFCLYPSIYLSSNCSLWKTHCTITSHSKLCNYLKRYYYLYVLYCIQDENTYKSYTCYIHPKYEGNYLGWTVWPWLRRSSSIFPHDTLCLVCG